MTWRLCEYFQMHPVRWDKSNPTVPMIEHESIVVDEWLKDHTQTMKLPVAIIDAETWRDADNPAFFGCIIVDRYGGLEDAVVGAKFTGEIDPATGKKLFKPTPERWGWDRCPKHLKCKNKERMEKCKSCKRVKPKNYGKYTSNTDNSKRRLRFTRMWCWPDEVDTVLIPLLLERGVKVAYAHNSTFDNVALLSALEPELYHPLIKFMQTDPKERSRILFRGSSILSCKIDIAPYFNKAFDEVFYKRQYDYSKKEYYPVKHEANYKWELEIKDSLALLPLSLGEIGQAVDFAKGETPDKFKNADHPDFENPLSITNEDIDYCIRDCEVLFRGLQMMWETVKDLGYHGNTLPLTSGTLGSQMIGNHNKVSGVKPAIYKKKKKSWKMQTIVNEPELDDICRLSMVGGRTQVFNDEPVEGEVFGVDANSHYPSVMTDENNSWPDFRIQSAVEDADAMTDELIDEIEGCVFVDWVKPEHDKLGLFAEKNEENLLDWCLGFGSRWITIPEYRFAKKQGYDLTIRVDDETGYCAIIMERLPYNPFQETITKWYDERLIRKNNNDPSEFALKILLNAGGFGKYVERNQDMMITTEETWAFMPEEWTFSAVAGTDAMTYGYATKQEYKRADTTANIMGAYILSYARMELWRVGTEIGYEHLIYCDTDSWKHTNPVIICPIEGEGLGEWKHENTYDYWYSTRPKQYKYHSIWDEKNGTESKWDARIKGCSLKRAAEELDIDYDTFCKELDLHGVITFEGVVGIKESWRSKETKAGQWVKREKKIGKVKK